MGNERVEKLMSERQPAGCKNLNFSLRRHYPDQVQRV